VTRTASLLVLMGFAFLPGLTSGAESMAIEGSVTWSGEHVVDGLVTVSSDATLVLRPGTRISARGEGRILVDGTLYSLGTEEKPVRLTGTKESDLTLIETSNPGAVIRLHRTEVSGAKSAVTVRGGFLGVTASRFTDCENALTLDLKASGELRDVTLTGNGVGLSVGNSAKARAVDLRMEGNRVGIGAHNSAELILSGGQFNGNERGFVQQNQCAVQMDRCAFEGNQVGVDLRQTRATPSLSFSAFRQNKIGVSASLFAHPFVDACEFRGNEVAFSANQFCSPFVRHCDFIDNGEAIRLDKKSNARIEGNRLKDSKVALFADFSSYPRVTGNLFEDNEWQVRLGIYESADWERQQGSKGIMMGVAKESGTRNPFLLEGQVPPGEGTFSVAGNAWDEDTLREMEASADANLTRFWDGRDQGSVRYEGFGEGEYAVDQIVYAPPLLGAAPPVGPGAWVPFRKDPEAPDPGLSPPVPPPGKGPTRAAE